MIHLCTYFDSKYLQKALALHSSLLQYLGDDFKLHILALDDECHSWLTRARLPNVTVTGIGGFDDPELHAKKETRTLLEYYWSMTPAWTLYVLRRAKLDSIAYIDADCYFFSDPRTELYKETEGQSACIIPHRFAPGSADEKRLLPNGTYNVSWNWFKNDAVGIGFLREWRDLCIEWCVRTCEPWRGVHRMGDQGYLDYLLPKYNAHVVQNIGACLAPWNQEQYQYFRDWETNDIVVTDPITGRRDKLVFYHFHEYQSPKMLTNWSLAPTVRQVVYSEYVDRMIQMEEKYHEGNKE